MRRKERAAAPSPLKAVGYWGPDWGPAGPLPHPSGLVDPHWPERERVAAYLRAGQVCASYRGYAWCRLCPDGKALGTTDLTDGEWVWPARLEHYVEAHGVRLPGEFVEAMRRRAWRPPADPDRDWEEDWEENGAPYDFGFWAAWASAARAPLTEDDLRRLERHPGWRERPAQFEAVLRLLGEYAPAGLRAAGHPGGVTEYAAAASALLPRLAEVLSAGDGRRVVHEEFARRLGARAGGLHEYNVIGSGLWEFVHRTRGA